MKLDLEALIRIYRTKIRNKKIGNNITYLDDLIKGLVEYNFIVVANKEDYGMAIKEDRRIGTITPSVNPYSRTR